MQAKGFSSNDILDSTAKIRLFTALVSLFLSSYAYYFDDLINADGILYMYAAQAYLDSGLAAVTEVYPWPFFSIAIASIHQFSGFSLEVSASILNTLLFVLLTDTLLQISTKILPEKRQLIFASLLILCFLTLNEYRHYIIRDIGYWAFCCLTLYRFMLFLERSSLKNFVYWQMAVLTSILFRLDGLVIFLGLPIYLLVASSSRYAAIQSFKLNYRFIFSLFLISFLVIGIIFVTTTLDTMDLYTMYTNTGSQGLFALFNSKAAIIETQVLNKYSADYSEFILVSGLLAMMVYKVMKGMTIGYLGIYFISRIRQKKVKEVSYKSLLIYFVALNVLILLTVLFHRYFILKRHAVVVLIGLLLLMLPRMVAFIEQIWTTENKIGFAVIGFVLLLGLVDGVTHSVSKSYIKETAIWASQNLPENKRVMTDDFIIEYYFDSHQPKAKLNRDKDIDLYHNYDYIIVVEKRKNEEFKTILRTMNIDPVFDRENRRGDKATVYAVQPTE